MKPLAERYAEELWLEKFTRLALFKGALQPGEIKPSEGFGEGVGCPAESMTTAPGFEIPSEWFVVNLEAADCALD